ncbi:MAG TPA: hypothetical protein PLS69_02280 [Terricaulis sp.]|nr:hypothetical protein [Terricaulis sp.]
MAAAPKYIKNVAGQLTEESGVTTATANRIPALDDNGRLNANMMPTGIGADIAVIEASESLAAGDWVNVYNDSGAKVRKADATTSGKEAHGFVLEAVSAEANADVYFEGTNDQVTSQTPGDVFLSTTPGLGAAAAPSGAGNVVQKIGVAVSATAVNFERQPGIVLA